MTKMKRFVGALLLTALLLVDGMQLIGGPVGAEQCDQSSLFPWKYHFMRKQYSSDGEFLGCWGSGNNCLVITLPFSPKLSVSTEGVHMQ